MPGEGPGDPRCWGHQRSNDTPPTSPPPHSQSRQKLAAYVPSCCEDENDTRESLGIGTIWNVTHSADSRTHEDTGEYDQLLHARVRAGGGAEISRAEIIWEILLLLQLRPIRWGSGDLPGSGFIGLRIYLVRGDPWPRLHLSYFSFALLSNIDEKTVKYFSAELKLQDEYLSSIAFSLHQRRHNKIGILKKNIDLRVFSPKICLT